MKIKLLYILIPVLISASCSSITKNNLINNNPEITLQSIAAFKSAEQINGNEWQLIFRKVDDCQYVLFYTDINQMNTFKDKLIVLSDNSYSTNTDFINIRFSINYIEDTSLDQVTGENAVINRLRNINRFPSDRFATAGFADDTKADDFILNLKKYVAGNSIQEISEMLSFPLEAVIRKKKVKISDSKAFIKDYNIIFNKRVKNSILSQPLADVQAGPRGLVIGTDEVIIKLVDEKICITSVNCH
ncbi:MAG TPA: hypothetical protein PKG60_15080 [Spirochaetota bacterium]|nr:hypothetical protein [Spirochaetota bacterium]HPS85603.1 hypothetical protein [Spirochaetota bacterium]